MYLNLISEERIWRIGLELRFVEKMPLARSVVHHDTQ